MLPDDQISAVGKGFQLAKTSIDLGLKNGQEPFGMGPGHGGPKHYVNPRGFMSVARSEVDGLPADKVSACKSGYGESP